MFKRSKINISNRFIQTCFAKTTFADIVYSILIVKKSCKIMKKVCLKINSKQSVNLRSGLIKFKDYFIQLAVPFKNYAVFKSALKGV